MGGTQGTGQGIRQVDIFGTLTNFALGFTATFIGLGSLRMLTAKRNGKVN